MRGWAEVLAQAAAAALDTAALPPAPTSADVQAMAWLVWPALTLLLAVGWWIRVEVAFRRFNPPHHVPRNAAQDRRLAREQFEQLQLRRGVGR